MPKTSALVSKFIQDALILDEEAKRLKAMAERQEEASQLESPLNEEIKQLQEAHIGIVKAKAELSAAEAQSFRKFATAYQKLEFPIE